MKPLQNLLPSEKQHLEIIDDISNQLGRTLPPASAHLKMSVIIPAKDEEGQIIETLQSLLDQKNGDGTSFEKYKFEILILCHNCADTTKGKSESFFRDNPQLQGHVLSLNSNEANTVGAARRILMNIAYGRLQDERGLIISTDADTIADTTWLFHLEKFIPQETSLVCGLISTNLLGLKQQALDYLVAKDEYLLLKCRLESLLFPNSHDPWPRHNYHWGPNLAIKKSVYAAVGGIKPLHFLEDVDLYNRVVGEGYLVRHCLDSKVKTSNRIDSRCQEGFGAELKVWTDWAGVAYNVEGLEKLLLRLSIYNLIRELYKEESPKILKRIAFLAYMDIQKLKELFKASPREESLIIKIEDHLNKSETWNANYPNKGVIEVCDELKNYFAQALTPELTLASPIV